MQTKPKERADVRVTSELWVQAIYTITTQEYRQWVQHIRVNQFAAF